jgi:DNA-binding response OmpR family regulator
MEQLNATPGGFNAPVIIVSAAEPRENKAKTDELGAIGYFQKPFDAGDLIDAVDAALAV